MKKPQSGIMGLSVVAALFLALAGTLPLAAQDIPASSVMPPGYLQAMPAADRVLSDMKVADSVETRARQYAAVFYLDEILGVLTWDHLFVQGARSGLTPEEASLNRGYLDAENRLLYLSALVPGLTALMSRYTAESSPLRSEILDRYFSPAWKAALMALDARYRVVENAPPTVQAEQRAPPATGQAEQRVPYFANLRCTPGATGAHGKPVSGVEKEACDMATAEIGKHWAKQPDGWTTVLQEGTDFAPIVFIRQVRSLAVERVETHELSAADKMNGFEWAGEVWFSKGPAREEGVQGFTLGLAGTIVRQGQWSQWVDYQAPPLRVQRVKGKWEVHQNNSLLEGTIPEVTGVGSARPQVARTPPPPSTLVVGIDVSGSFRQTPYFNDAIDFAALFIYGHLHGVGELRQATDIFVGSLGGERPGQPKTFHPIQDLMGKSPEQIAASLRAWFPETDPITDYNGFFERMSVHLRQQNLVLAPLDVVMFTDGLPDLPGAGGLTPEARFGRIDMSPLEYLSRSVTVRVLYVRPVVAQNWERLVKRQRVRVWTQDADIMNGWRRHEIPGAPLAQQDSLLSWIEKIVDFRVRRGRIP